MTTTPIFKMSGQYFGYLAQGKLFDLTNQFIGTIENNEVWKQDGQYLGVLFETNYILRQINITKDLRPLSVFPELGVLPEISPTRDAKLIPSGYVDALEGISTERK